MLFPTRDETGPVTKRDLIRYYSCVAPTLLPYLLDRPLNLHRYPDGIEHKGFWQKAAPAYAPDWIPRWRNDEADAGESELYLVADSPPRWRGSRTTARSSCTRGRRRIADVHQPTYALIDLDPGHRHQLGRSVVARPAAPDRARAPRRARLSQGDGAARHPDLDPDRARADLRRDPRLGRAAVARRSARPSPTW